MPNEVKNTRCKKCGEEFDDRYKKCPKCGEPNTYFFIIMKSIGIGLVTLMITVTLVLSIINTIQIGNIIDGLNYAFSGSGSTSSSNQEAEGIDIMQYDFYDKMELKSSTLPTDSYYLLYFHQSSCSYCHLANEYVLKYYSTTGEDGGDLVSEAIPLYFVTPDSSSALFDSFAIEGTPTLVVMKDGKEVNRADGYDTVVQILTETVQQYYEG